MWLVHRNFDSMIAALAGAFIIFMFTRHSGIGISPDSVFYFTAAENVKHFGRLEDFRHSPLVDFPSLYPLFLGATAWLTRQPVLLLAPWLNAVLFALVIFLSGWIMEHFRIRSAWYKRIILSCIILSPALLEVYSMLWSETLFILLILLFIIALHHYFETHSARMLAVAALILSMACVTRYAGVALVGAGVFLMLLKKDLSWGRKIPHLLLFGAISCSLLAANLLRNMHFSQTLAGHREKSLTPLSTNVQYYGNVFADWLPTGHQYALAIPIAIIVVIASCAALVWWARHRKHIHTYEPIVIICFASYSLFMILSATLSRYEPINSRLLSPLFITFIWAITSWIPPLLKLLPSKARYGGLVAALALFIAFQYNQLKTDAANWEGIKDAGIPGYTEDSWQRSPTAGFVKKNKASLLATPAISIYSNASDAIYFLTGLQAMQLPHRDFMDEVNKLYHDPHYYIIWFNDGENPDLLNIGEICRRHQLCIIRQFDDGVIYEGTLK